MQHKKYWKKTRGLMLIILALWFFFSFFIHFFVDSFNNITFIGFPLGFYLASQGSLIAFVIIIFYYARKQNKIDQEFGVSEND